MAKRRPKNPFSKGKRSEDRNAEAESGHRGFSSSTGNVADMGPELKPESDPELQGKLESEDQTDKDILTAIDGKNASVAENLQVRDSIREEISEAKAYLVTLKETTAELETDNEVAKEKLKETIRTTNQREERLDQWRSEMTSVADRIRDIAAQSRVDGLSSMIDWISQHIELDPDSEFGASSGPRILLVDDLLDSISDTDPNGMYVTFPDDEDELVLHLPWIHDNSSVQQTASTLALAFVRAIVESRPLSSSVSEMPEARSVSDLITLLTALRSVDARKTPGIGDGVVYANLVKMLLVGLSHAEYDENYAQIDAGLALTGVQRSVSEWLNVVAPQFSSGVDIDRVKMTDSSWTGLPRRVISDWLIGDDAFARDSAENCNLVSAGLAEYLEVDASAEFGREGVASLRYWLDTISADMNQGGDSGLGRALVVDLVYRLGNKTNKADWHNN